MRRYPYGPVEAFLGSSDGDAASELGVNRRTVQRWKAEGLSRDQLDRICDRLRVHPYEVLPELRDHDLADAEQAERERRERVREIDRRSWRKRWAAMTEEQREAKREYARRYRQEARAATSVSRRRYYQQNRERELARQRDYDARKRAERQAS